MEREPATSTTERFVRGGPTPPALAKIVYDSDRHALEGVGIGAGTIVATAGRDTERFDDVLGRARTEHGAKRNLRAMLDKTGWPTP